MKTYSLAPTPLPGGYGASSHSPAGPNPRAAIRSAIREERAKQADPARRVIREVIREEILREETAANPTPVQRMKAAVSEAFALSADRTKRKDLALAGVRGLGVGVGADEITALAQETAATIGCGFAEAVLSLTSEDAR